MGDEASRLIGANREDAGLLPFFDLKALDFGATGNLRIPGAGKNLNGVRTDESQRMSFERRIRSDYLSIRHPEGAETCPDSGLISPADVFPVYA